MTYDRTILFLSEQDRRKFPAVVDSLKVLMAALQAFGDPDEDEEELSPDSQQAAEAATLDDLNAELAARVWQNLTPDQRERFCKVVRDLFA
jgi:seryl-tRNA(Sec) selenium transferase